MKIEFGQFFRNKKEWDCENIICPIDSYSRVRYLNLRMFIRVLLSLPYVYFFGRRVFYDCSNITDISNYTLRFIFYYVVLFYLLQIIHEFIHLIVLPKPFSKRNKILVLNKKRLFTLMLQNEYSTLSLCISLILPFLLFSLTPILLIIYWKYSLLLLALSLSNTILSSDDLLNILLLLKSYNSDNKARSLVTLNNNL